MKRFITILFTTLLLTAALCVTASASDFDAVAEELSTIDMFRGTGTSFELDRAPTRGEAAIMLVRLYGAEEEAKAAYEAGELTHPFTDVGPIASPSVAWLYEKGITKGTTETTFGSSQKCNEYMYNVFLLRALGYQDPADFTYDGSLAFAEEKGFYWAMMFPGEFLRDDLAALTYQALAADMKDGSTFLLQSLVDSGAVDAQAAAPMLEKIKAYRAMTDAMEAMEQTAMDVSIDCDMDITMTAAGETMTIPTVLEGRMQMLAADLNNIQMAAETTTTMEGEEMDVSMWMKDGWMYMSTTYDGETVKVKYPVQDQIAAMGEMTLVDLDAMDVRGLAMIESIAAKKSGSNTVYTLTFRENMGGIMGAIEEMLAAEDLSANMKIGTVSASYTVASSGALKSCDMLFSASMTMEGPMEDGTMLAIDVVYDYDMTVKVNATGSKVKITWPDFSKFVEVDPNELAL